MGGLMPFVLRGLKLKTSELFSLVDKGAGGDEEHRPRIVLIKRLRRAPMDLKEKIKKAAATLLEAIGEKVPEGKPADGKLDELLKVMSISDECKAKIREAVSKGDPAAMLETALDAEGVSDAGKAAIMAAITAMHQSPPPPPDAPKPEPPKAMDEPKAEDEPTEEKPKPPEEADDMKALEKILKDAPEELKKALGEVLDENKALAKRLGDAEDLIAKQTAERELAEQTEVAKQWPHVPGDIEKRAAALLALKRADEKGYEEMVKSLASAEEMAKTSEHLRERGTTRGAASGSAQAKLESLAKKLAAEKDISYHAAFSKVARDNPKIYADAKNEEN
jgi:hypothetical protein